MAVTGGWTGGVFGSAGRDRAKTGGAKRSLGAALRDAGLGDAAPDPRDEEDVVRILSKSASALRASSALTASRSPRLAVFADPDGADDPVTAKTSPPHETGVVSEHQSVVSPPPWLREARRGRRQARIMNTFGWLMTLIVAGSIIGLAGRFLAVSPTGVQATMQARQ